MTTEEFLEQVYNQKDNKEGIKFLADNLSVFYAKGEYEKLMEVLLKFEIDRCPILFSIGLITFTNPILPLERVVPPYSEEIQDINKMRQSFLEKCREHFKGDKDKAKCFKRERISTYRETEIMFKHRKN